MYQLPSCPAIPMLNTNLSPDLELEETGKFTVRGIPAGKINISHFLPHSGHAQQEVKWTGNNYNTFLYLSKYSSVISFSVVLLYTQLCIVIYIAINNS